MESEPTSPPSESSESSSKEKFRSKGEQPVPEPEVKHSAPEESVPSQF